VTNAKTVPPIGSRPTAQQKETDTVPLVRIDHATGKPAAYRAAISQGVYDAMRTTFDVPLDDHFQIVNEHVPGVEMVRPSSYLGIKYSDDLTIIQITCNDTRSLDQKKALFAAIADNLAINPGMRREDVFVSLVEVKKENWSFGNGVAQYAG
jgi:4-oxalocrotonate tautomerase